MSDSIRANITLPSIQMGNPSVIDAHMIVARDLLQSIVALSIVDNISSRGCALIAAHTLECTLKAFLCYKGKNKEIRDSGVRHNLIALWDMVHNESPLIIPKSQPDWVRILSVGHGPNFYFRYQEGEEKNIVHGGQTPALIPMASELKLLFEKVEASIKCQ